MLNSRQRAQLRGMANSLDTIFQVGKGGINEQLIKQVAEALEARELIKLRVLETSPVTSREAADESHLRFLLTLFRLSDIDLFYIKKAKKIRT